MAKAVFYLDLSTAEFRNFIQTSQVPAEVEEPELNYPSSVFPVFRVLFTVTEPLQESCMWKIQGSLVPIRIGRGPETASLLTGQVAGAGFGGSGGSAGSVGEQFGDGWIWSQV